MEELLIIVVQFLFETLVEAFIYWPFESAADRLLGPPARRTTHSHFLVILAIIAGGVVGLISLVVWPHTWLRSPQLRIANIIVAPLLSAGSAWLIASLRSRPLAHLSPRENAWFGFTFTLALVLVRLTWGVR